MAAYLIVNVEVTDPVRYADCIQQAPASIAQYGGKYLARGGRAETLEGEWTPKPFVVLEFPTYERAKGVASYFCTAWNNNTISGNAVSTSGAFMRIQYDVASSGCPTQGSFVNNVLRDNRAQALTSVGAEEPSSAAAAARPATRLPSERQAPRAV
jgi:uncharacterized protein (DUF1330 family)